MPVSIQKYTYGLITVFPVPYLILCASSASWNASPAYRSPVRLMVRVVPVLTFCGPLRMYVTSLVTALSAPECSVMPS